MSIVDRHHGGRTGQAAESTTREPSAPAVEARARRAGAFADGTMLGQVASQAEQLMSIVGAQNLYAAYFLGKTELIGKK